MTLGQNICRLRTERGLSQGDLADALGVSRQSISKWETDASVPELEKLRRLSELFHISLDAQRRKGSQREKQRLAVRVRSQRSASIPQPMRMPPTSRWVFAALWGMGGSPGSSGRERSRR